MELLLAVAAASVGVGVLSSAFSTRKVKQVIRWRKPTKVERLIEQKELGRWLVREVAEVTPDNDPKAHIEEILKQLTALQSSANLMFLSNLRITKSIQSATTAMHVVDYIDQKYMWLLAKLVDGTVKAVLRASGENERARQAGQTLHSIQGVIEGFQGYSGASQITDWKN